MEHAPCVQCGNPVERRLDESNCDFRDRKTCSPACHARWGSRFRIAKAKADRDVLRANPRLCEMCSDPIPLLEHHTVKRYMAKRTCGRECQLMLCADNGNNFPEQVVHFPKPTTEVDFGNAFAKHNLITRDGGVFRPPHVSDTRSYSSSSASWAVREG